MTEDEQGGQRKRKRLWIALAVLVAFLAILLTPPFLSVSRYKSEITHLMAASLGRPVRLSSVEVRLLPRPSFILTDLTVEEDPAYGAEPMLHANTVTAYIRLLSLWRGRLEIGTVSVDEASLNLVRTPAGRWNLDSFFRTAAAKAGPKPGTPGQDRSVPFPYLEATSSRINVKIGAEKLPFSLINTYLSFWQDRPGDWRIRVRGQPARTDLSLDLADTGVVRLEASARQSPELRQMPVHLDLEWRQAQLGQLMRLVIGSDPGWRGDLTGELHLDGTADAAQITTRLRATDVHRAEFAPPAPMDFDARCGFVYHYSERAVENLACDSPLGNGRIHLAGNLPGNGGIPSVSVELDRIPVQAGMDALRTVRSGLGPGLEARGSVSGKITYAEIAIEKDAPKKSAGLAKSGKAHAAAQGPLTGSLSVAGLQLSGDGLSTPIQIPRLALEPVAAPNGQPPALSATVAIPAGGTVPLTIISRLALSGYQVTVHGQASVARARELAHVAGIADANAMDALAGDPVAVDLSAEGPWLPPETIPFSSTQPVSAPNRPGVVSSAVDGPARSVTDSLRGTVTLRNANWKADYLANHVEIAEATLHLGNGETRWDPVDFTYGPVKGTASLSLPSGCAANQPCLPHFEVNFGDLDASALQAAFLGAKAPGTLLSALIDRLRPSSAPVWPQLEGTVTADSLVLGPVIIQNPSAALRILQDGAEITGLDAGLLGGRLHGVGAFRIGGADKGKPTYTLEGHFEKLSPPAVGQLLGMRWSGDALDADGKIDLSGFTDKDLTNSAKGTLHFEWRHGAMSGQEDIRPGVKAATSSKAAPVPLELTRFDRWTADAEIAKGSITLKQNQVLQGGRKRAVGAVVTLGDPPKMTFDTAKEAPAKRR
jgi:hypothetical protein